MNCNITKQNFHSISIFEEAKSFIPRRIYCVGANYKKHVLEMGLPGRENPFYFMKPSDAIVPVSSDEFVNLPYPSMTNDLHHEIELVVVIGKEGNNIAFSDAQEYIFGVAVGLDMTRRDLQKKLRQKRQPWELAKAFDFSAPISQVHNIKQISNIQDLDISLELNGVVKQNSNTSNMIFSVNEIISDLSQFFTLAPGDLLFTGTPEGVGPVTKGDKIVARVQNLCPLKVKII
ncbi:MAG: fumarylacetoacetate hydrolase family protein [Burkholderiaceae bacterium]